MHDAPDDEAELRNAATLADAARLTGATCPGCGAIICGHEAVFSLVLGYKNQPRCLGCVAAHMQEPVVGLRERALDYVEHHDCFLSAWQRASELEGFVRATRPACLWPAGSVVGPASAAAGAPPTTGPAASVAAAEVAARWDAGGTGCGDLVLELRLRLREVPPGAVFELRATDPGAPLDLPAWCGLTGNQLVGAVHPVYWIRRKA